MNLVFRFEEYAKLAFDWEKRRMMVKSFNGPIILVGTGLDQNIKFGGCALFINNDIYKWNKSKTHAKLQNACAYVKISRESKEIEMAENKYLEARVEKDSATGFWIYIR